MFSAAVKASLAAAALFALAACATAPPPGSDEDQGAALADPAEPTNRAVFDANQAVDRAVIKPVAEAYHALPDELKHGIHNVLTNLGEPTVALNDVLQGNVSRASVAVGRFAINTTVGVVGVFDVAGTWGLKHHNADFGQTLGVWGFEPGPFVELPILGPSDLRDAIGLGISFVLSPFFLASGPAALSYAGAGVGASNGVELRADNIDTLDSLESTSVDYYATLRSVYLQRRKALVEEGRTAEATGHGKVNVILPAQSAPTIP